VFPETDYRHGDMVGSLFYITWFFRQAVNGNGESSPVRGWEKKGVAHEAHYCVVGGRGYFDADLCGACSCG
jgi:hypothetical protein